MFALFFKLALLPSTVVHSLFVSTRKHSDTLEIGTSIWLAYEPLYIALESGFKERASINNIEFNSASEVLRALLLSGLVRFLEISQLALSNIKYVFITVACHKEALFQSEIAFSKITPNLCLSPQVLDKAVQEVKVQDKVDNQRFLGPRKAAINESAINIGKLMLSSGLLAKSFFGMDYINNQFVEK